MSYKYVCPKCKHTHRLPGKCHKCGTEYIKICANCGNPVKECVCN